MINQESVASCRVLNGGYLGTKSKVVGQVEEEVFLRLMDGIFLIYFFIMNLASLM